MSILVDMKFVKGKVYSLLLEELQTRDDDMLLLAKIWSGETKATTAQGFFDDLIHGRISHFESVRRMRQKIQEENPKLRGESWDARHKMSGAVGEQLTFFDRW